ncbi:SusC/RagA family TonB-linked outer membrane protein [Tenuifilum thalassicum]|uniref:TonB-dependent receptor n=1 Tax=Tenuifilum thalassicum TaxID=2590900 RepID=A0A7D4BDK8_9BACT|nr:TonB-dependent receptor [Tenuifilum thalassicum]QKG79863.1 TonB-dependent receptor [Tenuifilum thalassicum]
MVKKNFRWILLSFILLISITVSAQEIKVSGTVTDANDGTPMVGVTVVVKGTSNGTTTNLDGNYMIKCNSNDILVFTFVGYQQQEVTVAGRETINISLKEEVKELDEVVVIGYGVQKKSDRTGSVVNVKAEELNRGSLTDPIQAMQGKVAGVNISKKGGDPNSGFAVQIRGAAGFASSTQPLYVIDGVPGADPTTISPDDIESFNILKDASSGAIYGSRASNGVIIITTKKASKNKGATIDYNGYVSADQTSKRLEFLSADDIRNYVAEKGITGFADNGANTNWQDEIFRTGISQSHSIAISNSTENLSYRLSYNNQYNQGVVIGSDKQRNIARLNLTQKALNDILTIDASLAGTFEKNNYVNYGGGMGSSNVFYQMYQRNPVDPVYDANGDFFEFQRDFNYNNPVAIAKLIQNQRDAKNYFGTTKLSLEPIKGLIGSVNLSYIRNDSETFYYEPTTLYAGGHNGYGRRSYSNFESKILEATINYTKSFNEVHNITLLGGYSFQEDLNTGLSAQGRDALSNYLKSNNLGHLNNVNVGDISSWKSTNRLISFFARATYNYNSKYFATATIRRDGSSKFGKNHEWGLFPSASVAWDIKKEAFLEDLDIVNQLKLRVGYGITGNQEISSYLDIMYAYPSGTAPNFETGEDAINFAISHNANPDLKWEENSELNIGLDYSILKNRIQGSIEYYVKSTYDLLAPYSVPVPPNALPTTWANVGQIDNKGLEINVTGYAIDNKDFKWRTIVNFATNKQKLVKLSNDEYSWSEGDKKRLWLSGRGLVGNQNWTQYLFEGEEIGTFYMPKYAGLSQDGKFLFYTAAGGVTRDINLAQRQVVGHAQPRFTLGWSNFFTYKNFDFNISLRGAFGNKVINVTRMVFSNPQILPTLNALKEVLDEIDRGLTDSPKISDYYLEDASFIKIDNISIGYNLSPKNTKWVKSMRVYLTSNNLYTFTNYTGLDPEMSYSGLEYGVDMYDVYPKTRTITLGIDLKF